MEHFNQVNSHLVTSVEEVGVGNRVIQVGPQQVGLETLGWLIGHLDTWNMCKFGLKTLLFLAVLNLYNSDTHKESFQALKY